MSRNNKDRVGVGDPNSGAETPPQQYSTPSQAMPPNIAQSSSPLSFVSPTEFVELPSGGKFYTEGHPLYGQDVLEIRHMTTKEEDILSSSALLKQGKAIDRLLEQIIVDKRIHPDNLLVGDKNAVLVAARKSGYGSIYTTEVTCPKCQESSKYDWNLDSAVVFTGNSSETPEGTTKTENGTFIIESLPVTKWNIEVRPLTGADEKFLANEADAKRKQKLSENLLVTQMSLFVVSISGVTDRLQIHEAVSNLPIKDARHLRKEYQKIIPNIDISQVFVCSECDHSGDMEVPFTTDFFWPK